MKLFGSLSSITFSPIVTIEPRRRKFHCPIRLKIPLPASYRSDLAQNLRLLCSISGGQNRAIWEDVTGSTPLSVVDGCLLFTTTVSARFWLVHCQKSAHCADSTRYAQEIYRHVIAVPFMAKFVVFAKRRDINEANIRVFCMTDDKEERTLEVQEHYTQVAKSRDVEVLEGQTMYLEVGGNLMPAHLAGPMLRSAKNSSLKLINEQLAFGFRAFQENRLAFAVQVREIGQDPSGRIAFMEDSIKYLASLNAQQRAYLAERRRRAICTLGVALPQMCVSYDDILGTPKRNSHLASARIGDLSLADIASELEQVNHQSARSPSPRHYEQREMDQDSLASSLAGGARGRQLEDWLELAPKLGIPRDEVDFINDYCRQQAQSSRGGGGGKLSPALILLLHWYKLSSDETRDQDLARALLSIGRDDIATRLNFPIEPKRISRSTMELLHEIEMIPVRSSENLYASKSDLGGQQPFYSASRGTSLRRLNDEPIQADRRTSLERIPSSGSRQTLTDRTNQQPTMETRVSSREWTERGEDGNLSYRVEHRTFIESSELLQQQQQSQPANSIKQRRRKGSYTTSRQPQAADSKGCRPMEANSALDRVIEILPSPSQAHSGGESADCCETRRQSTNEATRREANPDADRPVVAMCARAAQAHTASEHGGVGHSAVRESSAEPSEQLAATAASHDLDTLAGGPSECGGGADSSLESRTSDDCTTMVAACIPAEQRQPPSLNVNGSAQSSASIGIARREQKEGAVKVAPTEPTGLDAHRKGFVEEPIRGERVGVLSADLNSGSHLRGSSWCGPPDGAKFRDAPLPPQAAAATAAETDLVATSGGDLDHLPQIEGDAQSIAVSREGEEGFPSHSESVKRRRRRRRSEISSCSETRLNSTTTQNNIKRRSLDLTKTSAENSLAAGKSFTDTTSTGSSNYVTAPICLHTSTAATTTNYEDVRSSPTDLNRLNSTSSTSKEEDYKTNCDEMVANLSLDLVEQHRQHSLTGSESAATITPGSNIMDLDTPAPLDLDTTTAAVETSGRDPAAIRSPKKQSSPIPSASNAAAPAQPTSESPPIFGLADDLADFDDERLKRILACKRLSEGCLNRLQAAHFIQRKNSLHMIEELPALTEGEPMRHVMGASFQLQAGSPTIVDQQQSSSSGGSGTSGSSAGRQRLGKRGSQEDNTTNSCSSSTSLDRSPTSSRRRRSSTVSQCSSVLSEGTRQQLNFDLSPDLPPDSSLLEANALGGGSPTAISPTELLSCERPASPEPESLVGGAGMSPPPFAARPISRMSNSNDSSSAAAAADLMGFMLRCSPDSTLGDSNDQEMMAEGMARLTQCYGGTRPISGTSPSADVEMAAGDEPTASERENPTAQAVEQLIDNVSGVLVSDKDNISETVSPFVDLPKENSNKRQHYSSAANSICSYSSSSTSASSASVATTKTASKRSNAASNAKRNPQDELRLRAVAELERKDQLRASGSRSLSPRFVPELFGKRTGESSSSSQDSRRAHVNCYCHSRQ